MIAPVIATASTLMTAAIVGTLTYAALSSQSQIFGRILLAGGDLNQIALTFDDGPNPAATPQLLDILAAANVQASFFLVGQHVRQQPSLTRQITAAGHALGNHTMTHPWLVWQSDARICSEIADCSKLIEDTAGAPVHLFRPPHGARRPFVLRAARELGLTPVNWNIITQDWSAPDAATILTRIQHGIGKNHRARRASNVVLHDGDGNFQGANRLFTLEATRQLLALCKNTSHRFVTPDVWL